MIPWDKLHGAMTHFPIALLLFSTACDFVSVTLKKLPFARELRSVSLYALVHRVGYKDDVAAGQLARFEGASEAPISELIRVERATRKNSQLAAARRVALKMGRRPRCSSVTYRFRYAPSSRLADGPF